HTRFSRDWSSDVCSSDLLGLHIKVFGPEFQLCHILYPQDPSILGGSYWNVPVLGQGVEPPRIPEHVLQGGSIATIRVFPDLSGRSESTRLNSSHVKISYA